MEKSHKHESCLMLLCKYEIDYRFFSFNFLCTKQSMRNLLFDWILKDSTTEMVF